VTYKDKVFRIFGYSEEKINKMLDDVENHCNGVDCKYNDLEKKEVLKFVKEYRKEIEGMK